MPIPIQAVRWVRENAGALNFDVRESNDIIELLEYIAPLRPKTAYDSRKQLRLVIHGPLPTVYKGQTYGIPIEVWLTPKQAPDLYVKPTSSMQLANWVGPDGRVPVSTKKQSLLQLLTGVSENFKQRPPVFAKPKNIDFLTSVNAMAPVGNFDKAMKDRSLSRVKNAVESIGKSLEEIQEEDRNNLEHAGRVLSHVETALQRERSELQLSLKYHNSNISILRNTIEQARAVSRDANQFPQDMLIEKLFSVNPDDYYRFEAESEDRAASDAIAVLSRALDAEKLPLEVFLKQTRALAREQFLCRAALKQMK